MQVLSQQRHKVNRAINHIRSHIDKPLSLDTLAEIACMSKFHFINVFYKHCRETPIEFLGRVRLEYAIDNLVYFPDTAITDVAFNCGYKNPQAFSRAFRQRYLLSPRAYRKANSWRFDIYPQNQMEREFKNLNLEFPDIDDVQKTLEFRHMPQSQLAYIRHIGLYENVSYRERIKNSFKSLVNWAKMHDIWNDSSALIGIAPNHPAVTPSRYCIYDVALPVCNNAIEDDLVGVQTMAESFCVVLTLVTTAAGIHAAWDWLISSWLPDSGMVRAQDLPCFERHPQTELDPGAVQFPIELWMPLKKLNAQNIA